MQSKKMLCAIGYLMLFFLMILNVKSVTGLENTFPVTADVDLFFTQNWDDSESNDSDSIVMPDITSVVNNLSEFVQEGYTVYLGNQTPEFNQTFQYYHVHVRAIQISVYDDHDYWDAGDINLRENINKYMAGNIEGDCDTFYIGEMNDYTSRTVNIMLYDDWTSKIQGELELFDTDPDWDDSLGTTSFSPTIENQTLDLYITDGMIRVVVEVDNETKISTAQNILDAYKPYLHSDQETTYSIAPSIIYGRIIAGNDTEYGGNSLCLQYLYYYPYEYTGSDKFVHNWDWEMLLLFVDLTESVFPYRLVWDNGFYFDSDNDMDWIDGQKYCIFEKNAEYDGGFYQKNVIFTESLWPLLGHSRNMDYYIYDIDNAIWGTYAEDKWYINNWGMPTVQACIDTSYHQFDLGPSNFYSDFYLADSYSITPLDEARIKELYMSLNISWQMGIHDPNYDGVAYTPNYAPFSWDLMQPFNCPYIINNYPRLCVDINAYNGAKENKHIGWDLHKKITTTLITPCEISCNVPIYGKPGENLNSDLDFNLKTDESRLEIDVNLVFDAFIKFFFLDHQWNSNLTQKIIFYYGNHTLCVKGNPFNFNIDLEDISFDDIELGDYFTISGDLNFDILGTLMNATLSVDLKEIIASYIGNQYSFILDLIMDSFTLEISPSIIGLLDMDVILGDLFTTNSLHFETPTQNAHISSKFPTDPNAQCILSFQNVRYGVNFKVDWAIEIDWSPYVDAFVEPVMLHTIWPDMNVSLFMGNPIIKTYNGIPIVAETNSKSQPQRSNLGSQLIVLDYTHNSTYDYWVLKNAFNQDQKIDLLDYIELEKKIDGYIFILPCILGGIYLKIRKNQSWKK